MPTIIEQLAEFAVDVETASLPAEVIEESKRILLDSLGCAVASLGDRGAEIAVRYGRVLGGDNGHASIIGTKECTSELGAAFANAELINALDQDPVLPPGHVTPYVLPGALAAAEVGGRSGARLLTAIAVAHEISYRIGKATDYLRDMKDGVVTIPPVIGYSSTIFGATAAIGLVNSFSRETVSDALGIAGCTAPVNYQRAWMMHAPSTTIKYQLAGGQALVAMTAAHLAEFGHRGDRQILDDREFGFPRFIGTGRWVPEPITANLGTEWTFTPFQSFKPYPHCRVLHALLDALTDIVEDNDIKPDEIDSIRAWGESFVLQPVWLNETVEDPRDAQFSMAHGLAVGAHRRPPGRQWQDPEFVSSPSVMNLMKKVTYQPHPDYAAALTSNPAARQSRIEVVARGTTFAGERHYPKGSPSPDPSSYMTNDELTAKFRRNVDGVLHDADADAVVEAVFALEDVEDVRSIMDRLRP
ncbi:MmgE/PrpD family protein [Skermania sp. ID1734]|uniref:MmgE/PrpD family protein n=1 Tax=Skermania sp. ID1734 TaxID=2597516 RepID=UPI00117FA6C6|nr:MmgE/PrpD family protein [Skermania sp. ID1734]TSD94097.1 MmgE/PrpD family protein [Skermania sp. ID1734]